LLKRILYLQFEFTQWPFVHSPCDFISVVTFLKKCQDRRRQY